MYSVIKSLVILITFIPFISEADVVRCKFGSIEKFSQEFTIVLPSEEDKKYVGYFDSEYPNIDTLEILGRFEIGKVIDNSGEKTAIVVNNRKGWKEVIWLPSGYSERPEYSKKITWDPTGRLKGNLPVMERLEQSDEITEKNKGYAEYTTRNIRNEGVCK